MPIVGNANSVNKTNQSAYDQLGLNLSSDNPQSQQIQNLVSQLSSLGYKASDIQTFMRSGVSLPPNLMGGNAAASAFQSLQSLIPQAQTWESQNQGTSPGQRALNNQITQTAENFQSNIPQLEYTLTAQAAAAQKQQLATAIQGIKNNYNARGLLYGGAEQGAEVSNVGQAASNVATAAADINQNVTGESEQLNQAAINNQNALTAANQASAANQTQLTGAYNSLAEQNQALANNAIGAIGQGIGGALGTGLSQLTNSAKGGTGNNNTELTTSDLQAAESQGLPTYNYQSSPSKGLGSYGGLA